MGKLNRNKANDITEIAIEDLQKIALSFIPAGPVLDAFLNSHTRLKQKRIIDFAGSVKKALEEMSGRELHASDVETSDFIDITEMVYECVHRTRSELKLVSFQNIIVKQIIDPSIFDTVRIFIRLLDELDELEIVMLDTVRRAQPRIKKGEFNERIDLSLYKNREGLLIDDTIMELSLAQLRYFENNLVSKGLIALSIDDGIKPSYAYTEAELIEYQINKYQENDLKIDYYELTDIGKAFLNHIEEYKA